MRRWEDRRVVVTGVGVVASCGLGATAFWDGLVRRPSDGAVRLVPEWDSVQRFGVKEARRIDRFAQFALIATKEALADAGRLGVAGDEVGVVIGTGMGGVVTFEDQVRASARSGTIRVGPYVIPAVMA